MTRVRSIFLALALLTLGASVATLIDVPTARAGGGNGGGYVGGSNKGP